MKKAKRTLLQMSLISSELYSFLQRLLGDKHWIVETDKLTPYLQSSTGAKPKQGTLAVVQPSSVIQVQEIVRFCNQHKIAIVPQGGNTGRCHGALPQQDGNIILSLEKLNRIRSIDTVGKTAIVDSGIILDTLNDKLACHDLWFPISLGASGSCHIGGNIATNAGGVNALKYGTTRKSVLGIEAVLADGSLYQHLSPLHKDNRGYAIDQLLIGSEGTLAILTGASLKLISKPSHYVTYFLSSKRLEDLLFVFSKIQQITRDGLSAAEVISRRALTQMREVFSIPKLPLPLDEPWYALFEIDSCREEEQTLSLQHLLQQTMMDLLKQQKITQVLEGQHQTQRQSFWDIREKIVAAPVQLMHKRRFVRSDIAVPIHELTKLFEQIEEKLPSLPGNFLSYPYGHMGDGNIHYNFYTEDHLTDEEFKRYSETLSHFVRDTVLSLEGTFSAEHGIGSLKMNDLMSSLDETHWNLLIKIKKTFDPHQLLNPHTVIPSHCLTKKTT